MQSNYKKDIWVQQKMNFENLNIYLLIILNAVFTGTGVSLGSWIFKSFIKKRLELLKTKIRWGKRNERR